MNVEIRRLYPGDDAVVMRIAEDVFDEPVDPAGSPPISPIGHHMIVALADGEVIGQCAAVVHRHPDKPTDSLDDVGVSPASSAGSISTQTARALSPGISNGCEEVWVGTEPDNLRAASCGDSMSGRTEAGAFEGMLQYSASGLRLHLLRLDCLLPSPPSPPASRGSASRSAATRCARTRTPRCRAWPYRAAGGAASALTTSRM